MQRAFLIAMFSLQYGFINNLINLIDNSGSLNKSQRLLEISS